MNNVFRRSIPFLMATVFGTGVLGISGIASAQNQADPPARVGRLAFAEGTVSFHDAQDSNWTAAAVNDALTSGDSVWTEPNARSELSVAGTRVRLDQSTQLDMLQLDDSTTRLQLDQGRLDIKTFTMDTAQPYEIVTPRGTVKLEAQGDYYIESGSTQDPTRLGVRSGAAQITGLNGQVLAVRAGEVGEITGDAQSPQLHTIKTAPPPVPQYWAQRDQQVSYAAPQYISSDVVGYEDMQAYGGWSNDPEYGQVWSPNTVPANWQPYSTGSWAYSQPYGWTWVDEQPWGFAPYHYGRWANRNNRWFWVPPERRERAVYAPALVAFVGGAELSLALGSNSNQPVGWFPLGPREAYVPPYTNNRAYYERINNNARVERAVMDDRWQRAERHEAIKADDQREHMANRRFTTVVPAQAFVSSQRVERAAIKVSADKLASAPIAAVSAPPAPAAVHANGQANGNVKAEANGPRAADTRFNGVQQLARPEHGQRPDQRQAPGPKVAEHATPPAPGAKAAPPQLQPRNGAAPPVIQGERTQAQQPNRPGEPNRPAEANRAEPPKPGQPGQPATPQGQQANRPGEPNRPAEANRVEPPKPGQPGQPATPQGQQANRPEPPKPGQPATPQGQQANRPEPPKPGQPAATQAQHPEPQRAEPQRPAENRAAPQQPQHVEPQHQAQQPAHQPEPQRPAENHAAPPQPQHAAPAPQPAHQAEAPHVAPPQPQHVQAPPPPVQHAAPPAPPVQHAPPQPQQAQAPHPAAPPPQAQHPQAAPAPAPHPAAPPAPAKQEEKK